MRYKSPLILLCTAAITVAGAYALVPWKSIAAQRLVAILESKGFENVRLTVDNAGLSSAHLQDITIGAEDPLTLRDLTLQYHWRELLDGTLRDLALADLALTMRQTDAGWALQGFRKSPGGAPFTLPVTAAEIRALLPFDTVALKNAQLTVIAPSWNAAIPADLSWHRTDGYKLAVDAKDALYTQGPVTATITAARADAQLVPDDKTWTGTWAADGIAVKSAAPLPLLNGTGTVTAHADHIKLGGQLTDADNKTSIAFTTAQYFTDSAKNLVTVTEAIMPWQNGTVAARNVAIPIGQTAPIRFDLIVDKVALNDQITKITGNRVTANATASGAIPLIYNPGGTGMPTLTSPKDGAPTLIALSWNDGTPALTVDAKAITYKQDAITATITSASATAKLNPERGQWAGTWKAGPITLKDNDALPPLDGTGTVTILPDHAKIDGTLTDKDKKTSARFSATQHFTDPAKNRLTLTEAAMPWKNGMLRTKNVAIPLGKKTPIKFDLTVENVSLDELLQAMTGKRVSATGVVSGTLPLVYNPDGSIEPGKGLLNTGEPGTITMPPDAIPGDNPQIALTRDILSNFHYNVLSITTEQAEDGSPVILLSLEGNNPDVQKGHPVKLNVRLTGDVLDFIRQNVILLTTPEKLLQQETP